VEKWQPRRNPASLQVSRNSANSNRCSGAAFLGPPNAVLTAATQRAALSIEVDTASSLGLSKTQVSSFHRKTRCTITLMEKRPAFPRCFAGLKAERRLAFGARQLLDGPKSVRIARCPAHTRTRVACPKRRPPECRVASKTHIDGRDVVARSRQIGLARKRQPGEAQVAPCAGRRRQSADSAGSWGAARSGTRLSPGRALT
jgi:hypothetical protein